MTEASLTANDVAHFLKENPEFFHHHAELFSQLRVPHPNETRAISLGERQIMTLRARAKDLEWKLSGLVHNATGNEKITRSLTQWCCQMLAEPDAAQIPAHIVQSLTELFTLPAVALKLWGLSPAVPSAFTEDVSDSAKQYIRDLDEPYCGPFQGHEAAAWLTAPPASLAIIPLSAPAFNAHFGALVLGSDDAERFSPDMGTAFLESIGELAGASLSRLKVPDFQDCA
jgi:uncharacterized protein YigA (DUF484 family)